MSFDLNYLFFANFRNHSVALLGKSACRAGLLLCNPDGLCAPLLSISLKVSVSVAAMKEEDRPNKVLVVILTDGQENCD
jgi:hypothetical protein